jgi:predicted Zn-dependent protease
MLALGLALLIAVPAWPVGARLAPELPDPGHPGMSREKQEQLGLKTAAEVYKLMPVLPDSNPVTQYVQRLGSKLVAVIPRERSWPYQFHVIQQSDINAFALPGGPIFINIGTINAADNEAQLAGVLSHEMSHVYMQHSAKQAPKQEWASILGALGGLLGGTVGDLAQAGIQLGAGTLLMKYSRGDEAQADAVGAIIMYKTGYNPRSMAEFFAKLEKLVGNGAQFLSDHPNPGNRVAAVDREIANWPPKPYLPTSPWFLRAKQDAKGIEAFNAQQIADGAKSGQWAQRNRQSGAVPRDIEMAGSEAGATNNTSTITDVSYQQIEPSSEFKSFEGSGFSIAYPANWQAGAGQNSATFAPVAGVGQNAIAYGAIIASAPNVDATSLNDATQGLIPEAAGSQSRTSYLREPAQDPG